MREILKRYLLARIAREPNIFCSTSFVEGDQILCYPGIKLLLVRSSPQGIEQTLNANDPVVGRKG
jgi:hypothetical protein